MRRSLALKGAILVAAAAGFLYAFTTSASAKVVEPGSAYQPTSVELAKLAVDASKPSTDPFATAPKPIAQIQKVEPAPATPAPEQVVTAARPETFVRSTSSGSDASPLSRVTRPLRRGALKVGSYLERVASSCPIGAGPVTGGPVMVFAVLSIGLALERRRVLAARPATAGVVRELLYARELTPPG